MSPIKPENKKLYPVNWKEIRAEIAERSRSRCEQCFKPGGETVVVGTDQNGASYWSVKRTQIWNDENGNPQDKDFTPIGATIRRVRIILTVAHLDQDPTNNGVPLCRLNLKHLCQRCHLAHDRKDNLAKAKATREAKKNG